MMGVYIVVFLIGDSTSHLKKKKKNVNVDNCILENFMRHSK